MKMMNITKNFVLSIKQQLIILLLLAFGLNFNTLFNNYVVDDVVVLTENTIVKQGIKGIPELLTTEFFFGLEKKDSDLQGGRYRPFALVLFAIEFQFFGANPIVSHLINILLFTLLISLLFRLLQKHIFRHQNKYLAFITCLLFTVHPIHTEVIANVKSRDELITLILLLVSSFAFVKYALNKSLANFIIGIFCFFLALLTRESAVPFIGIVPLVSYFFYNQTVKKSILYSLPLIAVFLVYMAIRIAVVGFSYASNGDILNSPFLYASTTEAFATKVFILFKYVWLLFFPHPLSCDYGYNQIPYYTIYSIPFILSSIFLISLMVYAIYKFKNRSIISFCIFYFFITIFLFANFIIDIGAPLAERLLFQPSIAFCISFAMLYLNAEHRFTLFAKGVLLIIILLFSTKTIFRNHDWKDNLLLYSSDVITAPNSLRNNLYTANQYVKLAQTETNIELKNELNKKAVYYGQKALAIHPHYKFIYQDLGLAYFGLQDYINAANYWGQAYKLDPENPETKKKIEMLSDILYNEGNKFYREGNIQLAIKNYNKSLELNPKNVDAWHNLSKSYSFIKDEMNAFFAMQEALKLSPNRK